MDIYELDSYRLSDAVKFHTELNPALWDGKTMRPEVREALLRIADDFKTFMGIDDLALEDITVSGSNAAFSYTPHSDIDLHLLVDFSKLNPDEVYQELFNAKKYQYNDTHDIKIRGYDVELYVQDSNKPVRSLGEYSLVKDDWTRIPVQRRGNLDEKSTQSKYEKLKGLIELATNSDSLEQVTAVTDTIKKYRQAGLDEHGEFGPENLAYKMLRTQGYVERLFAHKADLEDAKLSLAERKKKKTKKKKTFRYGAFGGMYFPGYGYYGQTDAAADGGGDGGGGEDIEESVETTVKVKAKEIPIDRVVRRFVHFAQRQLGLKQLPRISLRGEEFTKSVHSFGHYVDDDHKIEVATHDRHIMDILRTLAHELVHYSQHQRLGKKMPDTAGRTGSPYENEAHAKAGVIMRHFQNRYPEFFSAETVAEAHEGSMREVIRKMLPGWPDYVIKDWISSRVKDQTDLNNLKGWLGELNKQVVPNSWQLHQRMPLTFDMLAPKTRYFMKTKRQFGERNPFMIPRDRERLESAMKLVQEKGMDNLPPVIMLQHANGLELCEGWHRTMAAFRLHPEGFQINAWIAKANETVAEDGESVAAQYGDQTPPGPESPPTMPRGTVRVDVSDMYDWYKIGQHIANMKGLGHHDFGAGPPSTIVSFGDEDTEHKFIGDLEATGLDVTDIDPKDPKQPPGMRKIKTDPTYNVNESASDEAWELVGQPVPEIQQFVKQLGYGYDEQSVAKITSIIDSVPTTQIPAASIAKLKNLANKGNDIQTLKAIQQISGRPDAEQQYIRLMQTRDAGEGRTRDVSGYLQYVKSGNYDPPVLLKLPTGVYVIGGRTRLYAALALGVPANVKVLSVNSFKQETAEGLGKTLATGALAAAAALGQPAQAQDTGRIAYEIGKQIYQPTGIFTRAGAEEEIKGMARDLARDIRTGGSSAKFLGRTIMAQPTRAGERVAANGVGSTPEAAYQDALTRAYTDANQRYGPISVSDWRPVDTEKELQQVGGQYRAAVVIQGPAPVREDASGYIPTKKQARDPRYKTALTVDIRPGQLGKEANKLGLQTDSQGRPDLLMKNLANALKEYKETGKFIIESEQLDEVKMNTKSLEAWARSPEAEGIRAGFEAEMIFRNTKRDEDDEDMEPDYDYDERPDDIDHVIDFFSNDDAGYGLSPRGARNLRESLWEEYNEWVDEQISESWDNEAEDQVKDYMEINVWGDDSEREDRIRAKVEDMFPDDDADDIMAAGDAAPRFTKSSDQQAYEKKNNLYAKYKEASDAAYEEFEQEAINEYESQGEYYDSAREYYSDMMREGGDYDESDFLRDRYGYMSEIGNSHNLDWPYWTGGGSSGGERDWGEIADSLRSVVDMEVKVGSGYHSTTRKEGRWIIEPDGSLDPDDSDDMGLEIVSPPMPLLETLEKLQAVIEWGNNEADAYTNSSTGLHMGISIPYVGGDVDYVKLVLFMGDEYILNQFGRASNTYAASAMQKLRQNMAGARNRGEIPTSNRGDISAITEAKFDPMGALELVEKNLIELAARYVQDGVGNSKYTSAHIKDGYIEFRSPGGDYLAMESRGEWNNIKDTMLRVARAMYIAGHPHLERKEYAKRLYKLISPGQQDDGLKLFSQFAAGTISPEQLKKQWADAVLQKEVPDNAPEPEKKLSARAQVAKRIKEPKVTPAVAADNARDSAQLRARIGEPQPVGSDPYRSVPIPGVTDVELDIPLADRNRLSQTDIENRLGWGGQEADANYEVIDRQTMTPVFKFIANTPDEAARKYTQVMDVMMLPHDTENYGWRAIGRAIPGSTLDLQRQRAAQSSGEFTGSWQVRDSDTDEVLYTFSGVGNSQADANRVAARWLQQNAPQGSDMTDVTVVPVMR